MFSIIIPLYNKAKYIEKAIYSVVNQSFKDFELKDLKVVASEIWVNTTLGLFKISKGGILKWIEQQY